MRTIEKALGRSWHTDSKFMHSLGRDIARLMRTDANETATFLRQLTYVVSRTFDRKYPDLRIRDFVPVNHEVNAGAESFVWRSFDWAGMAKIITDYATDLPAVDIIAGEATQPIKSIGDSYQYSIQDMRASQMAGTQIETKKAFAARRAMENAVENLGAFGNSAAGFTGFLNNANVPLLTGADITGGWDSATSAQILDDLNFIANDVVTNSKAIWKPDTMILPVDRFSLVMTKPFSDVVPTPVGRVFLEQSPYIRNLDQWPLLDTADAAGTGPRAVVYQRSNEVCELYIPQEFEQFPPEVRSLAFKIACHMRIAGVVVYYPLGVEYVDGI